MPRERVAPNETPVKETLAHDIAPIQMSAYNSQQRNSNFVSLM